MIHGDGFHYGSSREPSIVTIATELQTKGYLVLAVNFRLAQCGRIQGQDPNYLDVSSGRPPEQTDDIKNFVRAARLLLPTLCNGNVGLLGGSGGGGHAAFVALDKTPTPNNAYPHWCQNGADDRPTCAVCLSGAYDMSDRPDGTTDHYIHDIENYTNTNLRDDNDSMTYDQKSVSPVAKVKPKSVQSFKPLYLGRSDADSMPPHQVDDMVCKLSSVGIGQGDGLMTATIVGSSAHSWALWNLTNPVTHVKIRDEVISFFDDHVKDAP